MIEDQTKFTLQEEREKVFGPKPEIKILNPCKIGWGILSLSNDTIKDYQTKFEEDDSKLHFFIPASGSGSRMFEFLYDFLERPNEENRSQVERFFNHLQDFAFFKSLPNEIQEKSKNGTIEIENLIDILLTDKGLGFSKLPKGLIPFHFNEPFTLNPFQEQILQGKQIDNKKMVFHFTIQKEFQTKIQESINHLQALTGEKIEIEFSYQDPQTESVAFLSNGEALLDRNQNQITKPAGHGALLKNLNNINSSIIFIKNIDNIQHFKKSEASTQTWKTLGGLLIHLKNELSKVYYNPSIEKLVKLNNDFQLYSKSELNDCNTVEKIKKIVNRPTRVCGMVINEGQPGGGPFWVEDNDIAIKQIVEKVQIPNTSEQNKILAKSTHFNPVMIALSTLDIDGNKFNLEEYTDPSKYFIVSKKYKHQHIQFLELPGLWNGSMAKWNTVFVDIPSTTFSPVKTVLDLLSEAHLSKSI